MDYQQYSINYSVGYSVPSQSPEYYTYAIPGPSSSSLAGEAVMSAPGILDTTHRVPCLWDNCNILLDDISAAGIMRHLKDYHLCSAANPWNKRNRGTCRWGGNCRKEMAYASYGKHVAAVHLRASVQCPYCHKDIGRPGLLDRHIRNYCTHFQRTAS